MSLQGFKFVTTIVLLLLSLVIRNNVQQQAILFIPNVTAFQWGTVNYRAPGSNRQLSTSCLHAVSPQSSSSSGTSITSNVISTLAVLALKNRLREQSDVICQVNSSPNLLLQGIVGPVTVKGKRWVSPSGALTCRAIEASIDVCQLDYKKVVQNQKLLLVKPSYGKAMVALNENDFANFITHPLLKPPAIPESTSKIDFIKDGTRINANDGSVAFLAQYKNENWNCELQRGEFVTPQQRKATITVRRQTKLVNGDNTQEITNDADEILLTETLSSFFNEMTFNLDGTYLKYRDMMITKPTSTSSSAVVMIALNIVVMKFPSPGLDF